MCHAWRKKGEYRGKFSYFENNCYLCSVEICELPVEICELPKEMFRMRGSDWQEVVRRGEAAIKQEKRQENIHEKQFCSAAVAQMVFVRCTADSGGIGVVCQQVSEPSGSRREAQDGDMGRCDS